jgi:hypothetical protein
MNISSVICMDALLPSVWLRIMLTQHVASMVASNSRVQIPDMVVELQGALNTLDTETIHAAIQKVYLVGQNRNEVLRKGFERACTLHDTRTLNSILDLDYESFPSVRPVHTDGIWPEALEISLVDDCACVLRCFLRNGLDPY